MQGSQTSAVEFITLLQERIASIQKFCTLNPSIAASVGNEITLLEMDSDQMESDRHWEIKLRCVIRLFLNAIQATTSGVLECVALPCLKIVLNTLKADTKGQNIEALSTLQLPNINTLVKFVLCLVYGEFYHIFSTGSCRSLVERRRSEFLPSMDQSLSEKALSSEKLPRSSRAILKTKIRLTLEQ